MCGAPLPSELLEKPLSGLLKSNDQSWALRQCNLPLQLLVSFLDRTNKAVDNRRDQIMGQHREPIQSRFAQNRIRSGVSAVVECAVVKAGEAFEAQIPPRLQAVEERCDISGLDTTADVTEQKCLRRRLRHQVRVQQHQGRGRISGRRSRRRRGGARTEHVKTR